jgi:thiaminase/transcriptional activator TenA
LKTVALRGASAEWWEFYMSEEHNDLCDNYRAFVDKHSAGLSDERRQQMLDNFIISTNYEYRFWDMAYNQEQWPLG